MKSRLRQIEKKLKAIERLLQPGKLAQLTIVISCPLENWPPSEPLMEKQIVSGGNLFGIIRVPQDISAENMKLMRAKYEELEAVDARTAGERCHG